ncbi:hypothetical protein [Limnobacter sp.]|uniref:hypothetical protein n=1 Tax=Limnobacter sp. TaxID=2003368 RepID=UPI002FE1A349
MPFINEYIPEADKPRYEAIEKAVIKRTGSVGHSRARSWTIDRERDIFLTWIKGGDIERARYDAYIFHNAGRTFYIETWQLSTVGGDRVGQPRTTTLRIDLFSEMDETGHFFKHDIQSDNGETLALLREAFTAERGSGVLNTEKCEFISILELGKGV